MNYAHADGSGCPRPVDITNLRDDPANPVYICGCDPRQQPYTSDCGCVWPSYREWERGASGEKIWSCWTGDTGKVEPLTPTAPMADEDPDGRTLACPDCDYRNDGMPGLLWLHRVSEHGARDPDAGTDRPPTPEPTESGTPDTDTENGRGAAARPARHTAWTLPAARKVRVDPDAHVCETSRCWQDCRNRDDVVDTYTDPDLTCIQPEPEVATGLKNCDHGYCACGGGPGITITTEKGRRGILAASIRRFGRRVLDNLRGW